MSDYIQYTGRLEKIDDIDSNGFLINIDDLAREEISKKGVHSLPNDYNSYLEFLLTEYSDEFLVTGNSLYRIVVEKSYSDEFTWLTRTENGKFEFVSRFFNGGTTLSEELKQKLKDM